MWFGWKLVQHTRPIQRRKKKQTNKQIRDATMRWEFWIKHGNDLWLFCPDVNHCLPNPCKNEGNCYATGHGYHCTCVQGFKGPNCDSKNLLYSYETPVHDNVQKYLVVFQTVRPGAHWHKIRAFTYAHFQNKRNVSIFSCRPIAFLPILFLLVKMFFQNETFLFVISSSSGS